MSTMKISVQHIDSVLPDLDNVGGVKIECDMNLPSMELMVARIRESISASDWDIILRNTSL